MQEENFQWFSAPLLAPLTALSLSEQIKKVQKKYKTKNWLSFLHRQRLGWDKLSTLLPELQKKFDYSPMIP